AHRWIVRVPVFTDVGDVAFVRGVQDAVERVWQVRDGANEFTVKLAVTRVPPGRLYGKQPVPRTGAAVDVHEHLARFPKGGAVLTTGGAITHVTEGWCIVLGPQDVARHVLAHEFGHVLGFRDVYFRGSRDLGADGWEVTEVIADPNDIMGAP